MDNEIALHETSRPFRECCTESGVFNSFWDKVLDDIASDIANPENSPKEIHYEILENHYKRFSNGFKNTQLGIETYYDDLREDFEERNLESIYVMSDIYLAAHCAHCENIRQCWANVNFSFNDFQKKEGLTQYGENCIEECFDDEMCIASDMHWYDVDYFILNLVKEKGYMLPIDAQNASCMFMSDRDKSLMFFARKVIIYNDCQVILVPQFAEDFGMAGKSTEPLLLTG